MRRWVIVKTNNVMFYSWATEGVAISSGGVTVSYDSGREVFVPHTALLYIDSLPEDHPEAGKKPSF